MKHIALLLLAGAGLFVPAFAQSRETVPVSGAPAAHQVAAPRAGELAPDFTVRGPDGREVRLSDFRGKTVLLDIWATWCGPCIAAMPHHSELAEKYAANDLVILAVCASDSRENYDGWVGRNAARFKFVTAHDPAGRDWKSSVFNTQWGVTGFPTLFVIDRNGRIVGSTTGGGQGENPRVTRLLAQAGVPVPTAHLPPEEKSEPKLIPMMGKTATPPAAAVPTLRFANMAAGEVVPDFAAKDAAGRDVKLSDFRGRPVFISFWTGARNPPDDVARIHAAYRAQGLAVWAINTATERAEFEKWHAEHGAALGHAVAWDPAGKAFMESISHMIFGVGMYPAYCVVGADGKLVGGIIGMGARVSGWLREIVGRAGLELTEADRELVAQSIAAARTAAPPAPAAMGGMLPAAKTTPSPGAGTAASAPRPTLLAAGAVAPDFAMLTVDGRELRLSDFKGKVVVLDFWATWCGPCIASFPHTQELAKKYADQDVVVLASGTSDTIAKFKEWIPRNAPKYPDMIWAFDPHERGSPTFEERASNKLYGVTGIPTQFIIGRDGRIVASVIGNGGKDDARTELALAQAGVRVDEATLTRGRDQLAKAAAEARARAAEAPRPPFRENYGKLKAGEAVPDFTAENADGAPVSFSSVTRGHTTVLTVWSAAGGIPADALAFHDAWAKKYADQGVRFVALAAFGSRAEYDSWRAANADRISFPVLFDPAGKLTPPKPVDEMTDDERAAFREVSKEYYARVIPLQLTGGAMAPVPNNLVVDAQGRFVGFFVGAGAPASEALGNLLLRAGVKLAEEDTPKKIWSAEETKPAPAAAAETKREMLKIGAAAPDFTTQDLDGRSVKLSDYRGKVVVLDFWATWCGPCMAAMPHTQKVAAQYKDQGVVVLGSCTSDTREKFEEWVRRNREKYPDIVWSHDPAGRDASRASLALYGVTGIPTQFVIDREGRVVDIVVGYMSGEVILDAALAKAGIKVEAEILAKAEQDLKKRQR